MAKCSDWLTYPDPDTLDGPEHKEHPGTVPGLVKPPVLTILEHSHEEEGSQSAGPGEHHPAVQILTPDKIL